MSAARVGGVTTLTEFLLARIAEDEATATDREFKPELDRPSPWAGELYLSGGRWYTDALRNHDVTDAYQSWVKTLPLSARSKRTLAECEANRKVVELCAQSWDAGGGYDEEAELARAIVLALASAYSSHPEFQEEWRA